MHCRALLAAFGGKAMLNSRWPTYMANVLRASEGERENARMSNRKNERGGEMRSPPSINQLYHYYFTRSAMVYLIVLSIVLAIAVLAIAK